MELKPNIYYKTILQYREAELLFEALKLDIFSYLDEPTTLEEFLKSTNYDKENTKYFLSALLSCGYIEKNNLTYCNTKCSKLYLSKNSSKYIGKAILFREKLGSISNIGDKVKDNSLGQNDKLDFSELAEIVHDEMYVTGRVDDFNSEIKQLFSDKYRNYKVLDLGGGSGVLSIEFIRNFPNSTAYVFETSEVACISKKIIEKNDMQDKIFVLEGDFNVDAIYINKLYPSKAMEGYFKDWEDIQKQNIQLAEESFPEQKVFKLEMQNNEINGKESLEKIAKILYQNINPIDIFCQTEAFKIEDINGTRVLNIKLPFVKTENISIKKEKYDIIISLLNETRRFHLPDKLKTRKITSYSYENSELKIFMDYD